MNFKASRVTTVDLGSDREITGYFTVFGIVVANQQDAVVVDVEIKNNNGDVIIPLAIPANDTKILDFTWIADKGISIDALSSDVHVTIFHSQEG